MTANFTSKQQNNFILSKIVFMMPRFDILILKRERSVGYRPKKAEPLCSPVIDIKPLFHAGDTGRLEY